MVAVVLGVSASANATPPTAWTGSGSGTTTVVSDGTTGPAVFRYQNNGAGIFSGNWTFQTTANFSGSVTLPYTYAGFHSFFQTTVHLTAFVTHAASTTTYPLVSDGPVNCCTPPSGGFTYTGTTTLTVQSGDTYGFLISGTHFDSTYALQGTLTIGPHLALAATSSVALGGTVKPTATLADLPATAGGRISFTAYGDNNCSTTPLYSGPDHNVTGNGTYTDPGFVPSAAGTVYWKASYTGNPNPTPPVLGAAADCGAATSLVTAPVIPDPDNKTWTTALHIGLDGDGNGDEDGAILTSGQARWYRVDVVPGGDVTVDLNGLPANYDLAVFSDIGKAFNRLSSPADLQQVAASFGTDAFSPSVFSPSVFSPSVFSPSVFSPSVFSPSVFSPSVFSPSVFSPSVFSPSVFSPSVFSPSVFSPSVFSPSVFSPDPAIYQGAQTRSLIGISANDGTASEHVFANVWNNSGSFYIRVNGRNGAYSPTAQYTVNVHVNDGTCGGVAPADDQPLLAAAAPSSSLKTLVLADYGRMQQGADLTAMGAKVGQLAARTSGAVVDLGAASPRVAALNAQADAHPGCVYAKNLVANAGRDVVRAYRTANPGLKSVVLVGNDHVIPFFRYPDTAGLGPESDYAPPVLDSTASEASLKSDYFLSQDAYGASTVLHVNGIDVPVPDLAVGRLVETPSEISGLLDAYLGLANGVVPTPDSSLVTGYDFMARGANAVGADFAAGLGSGGTTDTLISPQGTKPADSWTAAQLRTKLLGSRHDLIFLSAHFSANDTLAADYATSLNAQELVDSDVNLKNAIVLSAGCHAGYNIHDGDAVPNVTQALDWTEAFAKKGATLVAGTGYQYGDTDFLQYSQRLYANLSQQLRVGDGPVALGGALVDAKAQYLADTPNLRGIDVKSLLEATLYGLPMLGVDLPAGRVAAAASTSIVGSTTPVTSGPGGALHLRTFDHTFTPSLTPHTLALVDQNGASLNRSATWLSGPDGVASSPGAPTLPLGISDVTASGLVLRGVGFRGGSYTDQAGITPLTGAPGTELGGVHSPFVSSAFFPSRLWTVNYFGGLADRTTSARLMLTPAQYASDAPGSTTDVQRTFSSVGLRLFYSGNTDTYGANVPALAAPPTISRVDATANGGTVTFSAHVVGDPSAGIQSVWVTYQGVHAGTWESLDLTQDATDSTLWTGTLGGLSAEQVAALRFVVQAVNGVGLVGLDDAQGDLYRPGQIAPPLQATDPTRVRSTLHLSAPASGAYGSTVSVSATLSGGGSALAGKAVTFSLGSSSAQAVTDGSGVATATLPLVALPGGYRLTAGFDGDGAATDSADGADFEVAKLPTSLALDATAGLQATLLGNGVGLAQRSVAFVLTPAGGGTPTVQTRITTFLGRALLGPLPQLAPGTYSVRAYFGPGAPTVSLPADAVYESAASDAVSLIVKAPQAIVFGAAPANPTYGGGYVPAATGGGSGQPVVFSIDATSDAGVCTIANGRVSFVGVGTCVVDANQAGSDTYFAAPQVQQRLTVGKARLTVTADDQTRRFGSANPALTVTITGFVNGDTRAHDVKGAPACSTAANEVSKGGGYAISCDAGTLAADDYTFRFVDGTLTVTYTQTITGKKVGKLVVGPGDAVLIAPDATYAGPIVLQKGGALDVEGAQVAAAFASTGAKAIRVCDSKLLAAIRITESTGPIRFGGPGCAGNSLAAAVAITGNSGGVTFRGNTIFGALTITGNTGGVDVGNNVTHAAVRVQG